MSVANLDLIETKCHGRWAWEAKVRVSAHAWRVAYGPTRRSAIRRLIRQVQP